MAADSINLARLPGFLHVVGHKAKMRLKCSEGTMRARGLLNGRRMMPSFLVIGAQKAGTTFLYSVLAQHPQIRPSWVKEIHYFDIPKRFAHGPGWYRAFFPVREDRRLSFEASPSYLFHPLTPERIAQLMPDVKLIAVLREPAARALSHYRMQVYQKTEPLYFQEALDQEEARIGPEWDAILRDPNHHPKKLFAYSYRRRGLYLEQIERFERFFPRENLLVLDSDDLYRRTDDTLEKIEEFIGLDAWKPERYERKNEARFSIEGDEEPISRLREFYRPFNQALFEHLGWADRW